MHRRFGQIKPSEQPPTNNQQFHTPYKYTERCRVWHGVIRWLLIAIMGRTDRAKMKETLAFNQKYVHTHQPVSEHYLHPPLKDCFHRAFIHVAIGAYNKKLGIVNSYFSPLK